MPLPTMQNRKIYNKFIFFIFLLKIMYRIMVINNINKATNEVFELNNPISIMKIGIHKK